MRISIFDRYGRKYNSSLTVIILALVFSKSVYDHNISERNKASWLLFSASLSKDSCHIKQFCFWDAISSFLDFRTATPKRDTFLGLICHGLKFLLIMFALEERASILSVVSLESFSIHKF